MSDWEEIKRLAADLQRVQLTSTQQKLNEKNCIEIVTLLIEKGMIDVIFTNDGKEYVTLNHLIREVQDELYVAGGRINLVEVAKILNVDLPKVTLAANEIIKEDPSIRLILGQLIDENYVQRTAEEINSKLIQLGEINVSDLTVTYDLPSDFLLHDVMENYLGKIIHGKQDATNSRIFFTQAFVNRCKAKLKGALTAITRPTSVSAILSISGVKDRMFFTLFKELNAAGTLTARSIEGQYIPHSFTKMQSDWVKDFYAQNGFLEYSLPAIGVSDPKSFIQVHLAGEKYKSLNNCIVAQRLVDQVAAALEECVSVGTYLDVSTILPSALGEEGVEEVINLVLKAEIKRNVLIFGTTVVTLKYLDSLVKPCFDLIRENAKAAVESGRYQQYLAERQISQSRDKEDAFADSKADKKEERRKKAAGGSSGGGAQGRETKTKSTKKHSRNQRRNDSESDDEEAFTAKKKTKEAKIDLITTNDIIKAIKKALEEEGLEDLAAEIANHYFPQLSRAALTIAQEIYETTLKSTSQNRRQTHSALQDKLNTLVNDIRLYDKGIKLLPPDVQPQLVKYLLKTLGTDICNEIANFIAGESNLPVTNGTTLTPEQRNKIASDCAAEYRSPLVALNKAVTGSSVEDFLAAVETALSACSMILRKVDKKKDRTLILCHKHELLEQLENCQDPALILHLTALVIFTVATQNILHASGRHVSAILSYLQTALSEEQSKTLTSYHDLVLKLLSTEGSEEIRRQLDELNPSVKEIAKTFKKAGVVAAD